MVRPYVESNDPKFHLQINGEALRHWREVRRQPRAAFDVLQANISSIGYKMEESARDRNMKRMPSTAPAPIRRVKCTVFDTFAYLVELFLKMDDPESPQPPPPLKRQNALWGIKLLEALNTKGPND